jgi:hypothetical protein
MEIERSFYTRKAMYIFDKDESHEIVEGLKSRIKLLGQKVKRIDNNPRNEGQVHFLQKRKELVWTIQQLNHIITALS